MFLHFSPFFTEKFKSLKKSKMLVLCPSSLLKHWLRLVFIILSFTCLWVQSFVSISISILPVRSFIHLRLESWSRALILIDVCFFLHCLPFLEMYAGRGGERAGASGFSCWRLKSGMFGHIMGRRAYRVPWRVGRILIHSTALLVALTYWLASRTSRFANLVSLRALWRLGSLMRLTIILLIVWRSFLFSKNLILLI